MVDSVLLVLLYFFSIVSTCIALVTPSSCDSLWLRSHPLPSTKLVNEYRQAIQHIICQSRSSSTHTPVRYACDELATTFSAVLSSKIDVIFVRHFDNLPNKTGLFLVSAEIESGIRTSSSTTKDELFSISTLNGRIHLTSATGRGTLYGAFHFISLIRRQRILEISSISVKSEPKNPLRIWQCWDNLDGTIERGYAGRSIFHYNELPHVRDRYYEYARFLASMGINAISTSNVNSCFAANKMLLSSTYINKSASLAKVFAGYGIATFLTPCYSSPMIDGVGNLKSADPLNSEVQKWWKVKTLEIDETFRRVADGLQTFGGFLMKADSEGMPGPSTYNRTEPEGAEPLANALLPMNGVLLWRAFSHPGDIKGTSGDQPLMQYQTFTSLDGLWPSNLVLQIKNGPMDFQNTLQYHDYNTYQGIAKVINSKNNDRGVVVQ